MTGEAECVSDFETDEEYLFNNGMSILCQTTQIWKH